MPVFSATDCYVAQLHSMSMNIPTMARGNFRKIKKGQEVKSDILNATLNVLRCTIQTVKKKKNPPLQSTPPRTRPSPTPTTRRNERRRSETQLPPSPRPRPPVPPQRRDQRYKESRSGTPPREVENRQRRKDGRSPSLRGSRQRSSHRMRSRSPARHRRDSISRSWTV